MTARFLKLGVGITIGVIAFSARSHAANFHLGVQAEISRAYMNPESFNGFAKTAGAGNPISQSPFSHFSHTYNVRLFSQFKERFLFGVQFSPYSFTNGGASDGESTYMFNYKSQVLMVVLGLNLLNRSDIQLQVTGGFGKAFTNHVDLVYKRNGTDLSDTFVYDGDRTHPAFLGLEAYYMFPRAIFGVGVSGEYYWYQTSSFIYNLPASKVNDLPVPQSVITGQGVPLRDVNGTEVNMNLSGFKISAGLRIQY